MTGAILGALTPSVGGEDYPSIAAFAVVFAMAGAAAMAAAGLSVAIPARSDR